MQQLGKGMRPRQWSAFLISQSLRVKNLCCIVIDISFCTVCCESDETGVMLLPVCTPQQIASCHHRSHGFPRRRVVIVHFLSHSGLLCLSSGRDLNDDRFQPASGDWLPSLERYPCKGCKLLPYYAGANRQVHHDLSDRALHYWCHVLHCAAL